MLNKISIETNYDVVVVGGGTSGFSAGISAAREGARTLIIEEQAFLGGMATGGMVSMFMGFASDDRLPLKGNVGEMLQRLNALNACSSLQTIYLAGRKDMDVHAIVYDAESLKYVLDEMVLESGAKVILHSRVVGADVADGKIKSVLVSTTEGLVKITARVFIDASFHGRLALLAGVPLQPDFAEEQLQPGSLMFKMAPVDIEKLQTVSKEEKEHYVSKGIADGDLFIDNILARPLGYADITFHNMSRVPVDPLDTVAWSCAEQTGRKQAQKISSFLQKNVPGFEKARLISTGAFLGMRDSCRFVGKYTLTGEDVMQSVRFDDAVATNEFPVDIHQGRGYTFIKPAKGQSYIPFRCMQCEVENLLLTGRCISADKQAHGSLRVMITCMRLGQAAGLAAQKSILSGTLVRDFDGTTLGLQ